MQSESKAIWIPSFFFTLTMTLLLGTGLASAGFAADLEPPKPAVEAPAFVPPAGWMPPPLDPAGVQLETRQIGDGVYALLSNRPPVDNSGFVVGERGVLVIDAHFNAAMAKQIQDAVRAITDKPILYLANTNAHGDHTFGNHAFPAETTIVAHRKTAESMQHFEAEKALLLGTVGGNASFFDDVELRLPDMVFDDYLRIDLGGKIVELHHFGHGNTPGDTVVYVPETKTAWTGNLILGAASIPWAIEGNTREYLRTLKKLRASLDIETIIPGHVLTTDAEIVPRYIRYLTEHLEAVETAVKSGHSLDRALANLPLSEAYLPPADSPLAVARPLMQGFHRWNVKMTYLELAGE